LPHILKAFAVVWCFRNKKIKAIILKNYFILEIAMFEVENLEDNLIELHPFGSFPVWGMREVRKTELPEHEPSR
jgi:hypothetical protein